jgi:hypothetical protein
MRRAGHVAHMERIRNEYKILIKADLKEIGARMLRELICVTTGPIGGLL